MCNFVKVTCSTISTPKKMFKISTPRGETPKKEFMVNKGTNSDLKLLPPKPENVVYKTSRGFFKRNPIEKQKSNKNLEVKNGNIELPNLGSLDQEFRLRKNLMQN